MDQLEWTILCQCEAGSIEVQLQRFDLPRSLNAFANENRAILGLTLPPYPAQRRVRYQDLSSTFHELGNVSLTPPSMQCHFLGSKGPTLALSCFFDKPLFQSITQFSGIWDAQQLLSIFDISGTIGGTLDFILRRMAQEIEIPGFASETMIEGLGLTALAELSRHLNGGPPVEPTARGKLSMSQLRRLERYISETPGRAPTITDLAHQCSLGPRRFTTLFRATTGQSVRDWVDAKRMDKAFRLLAETNRPLKVITFDLGFASPAVFSMAFKRRTGTTPREYRATYGRIPY